MVLQSYNNIPSPSVYITRLIIFRDAATVCRAIAF